MLAPKQMAVVEMRAPGDPGVLDSGQREMPVPANSEILIKVAAAGVNGPDLVQRRGHYPPPKGASDLLGLEVSGEVVARGNGVERFAVGDLVCGLTNGGGYAAYAAVEADHCLPLPSGVTLVDAAGLPETYFTVWSNVFFGAPDRRGETILVHGGAGGIGATAIQLSAALGLTVMTTVGSDENAAWCVSMGADEAINYTTADFVEVARGRGGANVILDIVGGDYVARNIRAAAADGRIIQLAFSKGSKVDIDLLPVMLKRLTYTGATLRSRPSAFKSAVARSLEKNVWPLFAEGKLQPVTFAALPLADAAMAHRLMEQGGHRGKILLIP